MWGKVVSLSRFTYVSRYKILNLNLLLHPHTKFKKCPQKGHPMKRTEQVELTTLCLIRQGEEYLLQDRIKPDWKGFTLPGGHIEPGESVVDAVIREMKEETGLTIRQPRLCGVKQFPRDGSNYANGRYLVFLFTADEFSGEVRSSAEGQMHWIHKNDLDQLNLVADFKELLEVMCCEHLTEFQYLVDGDDWQVRVR